MLAEKGIGWHRAGENISYYQNSIVRREVDGDSESNR